MSGVNFIIQKIDIWFCDKFFLKKTDYFLLVYKNLISFLCVLLFFIFFFEKFDIFNLVLILAALLF